MNKKEVIVSLVNSNPNPDTKYCPVLVCYWKGNSQKYGGEYTNFYIPTTGQRFINQLPSFIHAEEGNYVYGHKDYPAIVELNVDKDKDARVSDSNIVLMRFGTTVERNEWTYMKFHPEYNMLEIAPIELDRGVSKPDKSLNIDIRKWRFVESERWSFPQERLFIFKNDAHIYNDSGDEWNKADFGKFYDRFFAKRFSDIYDCYHNFTDKNLLQLTLFAIGTNDRSNPVWPYGFINNYYKKISPRTASAKSEKKMDYINTIAPSLKTVEQMTSEHPLAVRKVTVHEAYRDNNYPQYEKAYITAKVTKDDVFFQVFNRKSYDVRQYYKANCTDNKYHFNLMEGYWTTDHPRIVHINNKTGEVNLYSYNETESKYVMNGDKFTDIYDEVRSGGCSKASAVCTFGNFDVFGGKIKEAYEVIKNSGDIWKDGYRYSENYEQMCIFEMIIDILKHQSILDCKNKGYNNIAKFALSKMNGISTNSSNILDRQNSSSTVKTIEGMMGMTPGMISTLNEVINKDIYSGTITTIKSLIAINRKKSIDDINLLSLTTDEEKEFNQLMKGICNSMACIGWKWRELFPNGCFISWNKSFVGSTEKAAEYIHLLKAIAVDKDIASLIKPYIDLYKRGKYPSALNPYKYIIDMETAKEFIASCK